MTIVVAVSFRIVGLLLITSMLIIPAATARQITNSPELITKFKFETDNLLVSCLS